MANDVQQEADKLFSLESQAFKDPNNAVAINNLFDETFNVNKGADAPAIWLALQKEHTDKQDPLSAFVIDAKGSVIFTPPHATYGQTTTGNMVMAESPQGSGGLTIQDKDGSSIEKSWGVDGISMQVQTPTKATFLQSPDGINLTRYGPDQGQDISVPDGKGGFIDETAPTLSGSGADVKVDETIHDGLDPRPHDPQEFVRVAKSLFDKIDTNKDGTVTLDELSNFLMHSQGLDKESLEVARVLFARFDTFSEPSAIWDGKKSDYTAGFTKRDLDLLSESYKSGLSGWWAKNVTEFWTGLRGDPMFDDTADDWARKTRQDFNELDYFNGPKN
jgi:hypothetical protein